MFGWLYGREMGAGMNYLVLQAIVVDLLGCFAATVNQSHAELRITSNCGFLCAFAA